MFRIILVLAVSSIGVHSQYRAPPVRRPMSSTVNQAITIAEPSLRKPKPCTEVVTITSQTRMPNVVPAMPPAMPVIPFVTELPNCPDLCFKDILTSPLGCLDPILNVYGTATDVIRPDLPLNPLLPSASPISALASPLSKLSPSALPDGCDSRSVKRLPIPPPFI